MSRRSPARSASGRAAGSPARGDRRAGPSPSRQRSRERACPGTSIDEAAPAGRRQRRTDTRRGSRGPPVLVSRSTVATAGGAHPIRVSSGRRPPGTSTQNHRRRPSPTRAVATRRVPHEPSSAGTRTGGPVEPRPFLSGARSNQGSLGAATASVDRSRGLRRAEACRHSDADTDSRCSGVPVRAASRVHESRSAPRCSPSAPLDQHTDVVSTHRQRSSTPIDSPGCG